MEPALLITLFFSALATIFNCIRETPFDNQLDFLNDKPRLVELLRARLIESGWRDELKMYTKGMSSQQYVLGLRVQYGWVLQHPNSSE